MTNPKIHPQGGKMIQFETWQICDAISLARNYPRAKPLEILEYCSAEVMLRNAEPEEKEFAQNEFDKAREAINRASVL